MPTSWETLKSSDGGSFQAYLAVPDAPNGGSVVVLQEIFGVNAFVRDAVEKFAAAGFVAIAPDLFWRQQPGIALDPSSEDDRAIAMSLMQGLDVPLALDDALAAADHVRERPGSNGRVGCVGYCLGGKLAFLLASDARIAAAVSYYGVQIQQNLDRAGSISSRLLVHIAQDDHLCPPDAQAAIMDALGNVPVATVMNHPGVGHAFARQGGPAFDAAAMARADAATLAQLRQALLD